jgi:hypothetical protein
LRQKHARRNTDCGVLGKRPIYRIEDIGRSRNALRRRELSPLPDPADCEV